MKDRLRSNLPVLLFIAIFVVLIVVFTVFGSGFLTVDNILGLFRHVSVVAIAALGVTFVVAVGHTDISFYLVACFAAMMMGFSLDHDLGPLLSVFIGLGMALLFGLASGMLVGVLRLPDIIITIAVGTIGYGCAYLPSGGARIYVSQTGIGFLNDGKILGLPCPTFLMIVFYIVAFIVLEHTKFGTYFYAAGSNKIAAKFSGIRVPLVVMVAFVVCVLLGSFAGEINSASVGNTEVTTALTLLLPCYTSVSIGRAIFKRPSVIGTFLGALLLQIVSNGFTHMNMKYWFSDLATSILLIVSLLISLLNSRDVKSAMKSSS